MALGLYFKNRAFTKAKYDEAIKRLEAAGAGSPPGRQFHVALDQGDNIEVFDIWDSEETFQAFGATLMPILSELETDPGEPQISKVHNIIEGRQPVAR